MKLGCALILITLSSCSRADEKSRPHYEQVVGIMLLDVQGVWGGKALFLKKDGTAAVQVVTPPKSPYTEGGLTERRFQFACEKEEVDKAMNLLREYDFLAIRITDHPGVPDEGRSEIIVRFLTGETKSMAKWANDTHPQFDPIYQGLLRIADRTASLTPLKVGRYDNRWLSEGFTSP